MRHKKKGRKLNRNSSHRKAMFANMATSMIVHGRIKTTLIKAKELRTILEPMITMAIKNDKNIASRLLFAKLRDKVAVKKLVDVIGPQNSTRPGGYLSILKCGYRAGDSAMMSIVQFSADKPVAEAQE
jgi:large subunit ribosomal protein L17